MNYRFIFLLFLVGCLSNHSTDFIDSPSKNYKVQAFVNKTDRQNDNYLEVVLLLFDKNGKQISALNTNASHVHNWEIGWTEFGDTLVLQSSDIGNSAWIIEESDLVEINMTEKLQKRAETLKH